MSNHVFITRGDIRRLACDAWLLPGTAGCPPTVSRKWLEPPKHRATVAPSLGAYFSDRRLQTGHQVEGLDRVWRVNPDEPRGPAIFLTDTGGFPSTPVSWYVEALEQFLEAVNRLELRAGVTGRQRPLVAVPVVGTGRGGKESQRGSILTALLDALWSAAATRPATDYVLVTFREPDYETAQWVRHKATSHGAWSALERPELWEAASRLGEEARAHDLVLFLGAGVSAGAGLPTWTGLLRDLAHDAGCDPGYTDQLVRGLNPLDAARVIERRLEEKGRDIGSRIAQRLATDRHSISHALLATLPVREVATTNYDDLFEQACSAVGSPAAVLPYSPDRSRQRWILKLHGSVEHPDEIVLTRDDYLAYGERRAALAGLVQGLLITKHMLFLGFSLSDENFHRIVYDVRKAVRRGDHGPSLIGTAVLLDDDPLRRELWESDLTLLTTSVGEIEEPRVGAARQLEIFLDRLVFETAGAGSHLLDPAYDELLGPAERQLRDKLRDFLEAARPSEGQADWAWARIEDAARQLGWREDTAG